MAKIYLEQKWAYFNIMSDCPFFKASDIDFMDPEVQENWFPAYDLIREESPAY